MISRKDAGALGRDTVQCLENGAYTAPSGRRVDLRGAVDEAVRGAVSYPPDATIPTAEARGHNTAINVTGETTLEAARRLVGEGEVPVALNFASAKNPGGGFLSGARAQEESIARSSALFKCIDGNAMYNFHRQHRNAMYTNYALYAPAVPVFRDDNGVTLEKPYPLAIITAPAPNAGVVLERDPSAGPAIRTALEERVEKVLRIAAVHGHDVLILGAWGCGAFRGDPEMTADVFKQALDGSTTFRRVVFAVFDPSKNQNNLRAFKARWHTTTEARPPESR